MKECIVLSASSVENLTLATQSFLADGWQLQGKILYVVDNHTPNGLMPYVQSLTKEMKPQLSWYDRSKTLIEVILSICAIIFIIVTASVVNLILTEELRHFNKYARIFTVFSVDLLIIVIIFLLMNLKMRQ